MNIHHVDSKEHTLSAEDVLTVVAHDLKNAANDVYKQAGSPKDVSPERVLYTVFVDLNKKPNHIRMREGNTIWVLIPQTETSAGVLLFDADTPANLQANLVKLGKAASKMGYQQLTGMMLLGESVSDSISKAIKSLNGVKNFSVVMHDNAYQINLP